MTKHTLKFSIFAAALFALSLPVTAAAQWGNRYPSDRGNRRYDERAVRDSVHRLDRMAKDFEREMDRALDRSRANGTDREDRINHQVHQFRDAVGDLKSRVGNGRDLDRSADEARRVFQEAQQIDRVTRRLDGRTSSQWNQIQRELEFLGDAYGFRYNGGYGRDDDYRRRDDDYRRRDDDYRRNDDYRRRRDDDNRRNRNNDDWWRRIPFPQ
jgi:translation initiation factor 3 subunit A